MFNRSMKFQGMIGGVLAFCTLFLLPLLSYASPNELNEIHHALKAKGKKWFAGETSVSRLHPNERIKRLGTMAPHPMSEEDLLTVERQSALVPQTTVPTNVDWSLQFVTPVRDQGACGSCWAFATAAALESQVLIAQNTPGLDLNLSEQALLSCGNSGNCGGGYISSASNFIRDTGLPLENCFLYKAANAPCNNACPNWQNSSYQIKNWHWVTSYYPTVEVLKNALYQYGPLVTTLQVYADYFYYSGGIYSHTFGNYQGGHAVLVVGYDDLEQYFLVKNSWGADWGENGYFKIAYSELNSVVQFGYWTIAYEGTQVAPPPSTASLTVSAPNGGETWQAGTTQNIRWAYAGDPGANVKIELFKAGVLTRTIIPSTSMGTNGSGSYPWAIPSTQNPGTDYKIKVSSTTNSIYTDTSNSNFNITAPPSITVSSPNSGENWQAGTTQTIRWTFTGSPGSYVKIDLLKGGVLSSTISTSTSIGASGSGAYTWAIPSTQTLGSNYQMRITSTSNSSYTDSSDNYFNINAPSTAATLTTSFPNGGESLPAGSTQTIRWTYTGSPGSYVKIELLKGGVLSSTISGGTSSGANGSGSYSWAIPSTQSVGPDYKLRITSTSNRACTDTSDNNFSINATPAAAKITMTSPNGGENWRAGTTQTVRWTFTENPGSYVRIELLRSGVLAHTITSSTPIGSGGNGSYSWAIPSSQASSNRYRIRVTSTTNGGYSDSSDFTFTITK